jgi:membrane protein DedA with SNARE-associated domain
MPALNDLVAHWGYAAIALVVLLGNVGLPVPEETILVVGGYLVWAGQLRFWLVVTVGVASAAAGDNLGYWLGRRFGRAAIERYGHWLLLTPDRFAAVQRFIARYGAAGVVVARFLAGIRFLAGPVAGATGLPAPKFVVSNLLGAAVFVPAVVGVGYGVGAGLGDQVERLRHLLGAIEHVALAAVIAGTAAALTWRVVRSWAAERSRKNHG